MHRVARAPGAICAAPPSDGRFGTEHIDRWLTMLGASCAGDLPVPGFAPSPLQRAERRCSWSPRGSIVAGPMEIVVRSLSRAVGCGDGRASRSNARAARATAGGRARAMHTGFAGAVTSWHEDKLDVDGVPRIASPSASCPKRRDRDGVGLQVLDVREQASGIPGTELERRRQNRPWGCLPCLARPPHRRARRPGHRLCPAPSAGSTYEARGPDPEAEWTPVAATTRSPAAWSGCPTGASGRRFGSRSMSS